MLDTAILGLIRTEPAHGYELHRRLISLGFWRISFGSVYPALRRLEEAGYLETFVDGRKKEYRITQSGTEHLEALLSSLDEPPENTNQFRVRLSLFRYVPAKVRKAILEARKGVLLERIHAIDADIEEAAATARFDRYALAEIRHRRHKLSMDVEWIDALLSEEKGTE